MVNSWDGLTSSGGNSSGIPIKPLNGSLQPASNRSGIVLLIVLLVIAYAFGLMSQALFHIV